MPTLTDRFLIMECDILLHIQRNRLSSGTVLECSGAHQPIEKGVKVSTLR